MLTTRRCLKKVALLLGAILLLLTLFTSLTSKPVHAYPTFWVLSGVTGYPQEQENWCWAATDKSIMAYRGTNPTQCRIANVVLSRNYCCQSPWACNETIPTCDNGIAFSYWDFSYSCVYYPLGFDSIRIEIYNYNRPFYASRYGHAYTVTGYDYGPPQMIYRYDPWPGHGWSHQNYDDFRSGWARTIYGIRK